MPSADLAISKDATRPRLAAALTVLTARRRLLGNQQPRQPQTDGGGGAEQQDVLTTRIDRDGRRLLYQLSPLHFSPPTTSLLSDEDMCMCIHNKPVGCLAGPSLSPPDSKVIRPLSGRCLRPPATASHFAPRRLRLLLLRDASPPVILGEGAGPWVVEDVRAELVPKLLCV